MMNPSTNPSTHSKLNLRGRMKFGLRRLVHDERGMSTVEYVILLAVIVVGAVATWNEIGGAIQGKLETARDDVNDVGNLTKP